MTTSGNAGTPATGGGGDDTGGDGGSGSASGGSPSNAGSPSGGTAGAGGGATVRGAISLNFTTMGSCQEEPQFLDLPPAASGHPVTEAGKAGMVENGAMSDGRPVRVLCRWLSRQSPHSFSAVVEVGTGNARQIANIGATGLVEGADGMGSVILEAPMLSEPYSSPNLGCEYSVIEIDPASRSLWGRFTCASVEAEASGDTCSIDASYFAFENCEAPPG